MIIQTLNFSYLIFKYAILNLAEISFENLLTRHHVIDLIIVRDDSKCLGKC